MKALRENFNGIMICLFELVIGILLLINPIGFTSGIIITAGGVLCLNGLINCIKYFRTEIKEASKGQYLTKGLVAVLAGAFCILNTDWFIVTFSALTIIYGVIVLLASVEKIQLCVDLLRQKRKKWYLAAISAVISLVCAAVILKNPFSSTTLIWIVAGVSLILEAMFDMYTLLENCRKQEEKIETREVHNKKDKDKKTQTTADETVSNEDVSSEDINTTQVEQENEEEINKIETENENNEEINKAETDSKDVNCEGIIIDKVKLEDTQLEEAYSETNDEKKNRLWRRKIK